MIAPREEGAGPAGEGRAGGKRLTEVAEAREEPVNQEHDRRDTIVILRENPQN